MQKVLLFAMLMVILMSDTYPPPPKIIRPRSALDALTQEQQDALTPLARDTLSKVNIEFIPDMEGSGVYDTSRNTIRIWSGLRGADVADTIMHESLHVMDAVTGNPSSYIDRDNLSYEDRQKIYTAYSWKAPLSIVPGTEKDAGKSSFIMPNNEIFASAGQRPSSIPAHLKDYYSMIYAAPKASRRR